MTTVMNTLVIGGNRFFGRNLVDLLLKKGAKVTLINRGSHPVTFGPPVESLKLDRRNLHGLKAAVKNRTWDTVFDLACYDAAGAKQACEIFSERTARYVFISSQAVYRLGANISESAFDPSSRKYSKEVSTKQNYAEGKRQAETVLFAEMKAKVAGVRFPIILGEDDYTGRLEWHIERIRKAQPMYFPNIEARISFINSADAASCLEFLTRSDHSGPINCASAEPIILSTVIRLIEEATEEEAKLVSDSVADSRSPFGIKGDWFMSTSVLNGLGFHAEPVLRWLPDLVKFLVGRTMRAMP